MSLTALADDYVSARYPATRQLSCAEIHLTTTEVPEAVRHVLDAHKLRATRLTETTVDAGPEKRKSSDAGAFLDRLMTYIPSEVIAAYVPLVALATPRGAAGNATLALWLLFVVFLICAPVAVILIAYGKYRQLPKEQRDKDKFVPPRFAAIAALVAFASWGAVMPSSVFTTVNGFQAWMGTAAVIVVTFLLTLLGPIFGEQK